MRQLGYDSGDLDEQELPVLEAFGEYLDDLNFIHHLLLLWKV